MLYIDVVILWSIKKVTCVTARLSSTTDLAKALQIGKQEKNEPTKLPAPYAISSWKETSPYGVDIRELLKMDFISPVNKRGLRR